MLDSDFILLNYYHYHYYCYYYYHYFYCYYHYYIEFLMFLFILLNLFFVLCQSENIHVCVRVCVYVFMCVDL
jgi:hypothetical protein